MSEWISTHGPRRMSALFGLCGRSGRPATDKQQGERPVRVYFSPGSARYLLSRNGEVRFL